MEKEAERVRTRTLGFLRQAATETLWLKRLILQRLDEPQDDADRSARLGWWHYTLTRLGQQISPPEVPRVAKYVAVSRKPGDQPRPGRLVRSDSHGSDAEWDVRFQDARLDRIERLIAMATNLREGAFRPFHENPTVRALLLPAGGYGSLELIQWMLGG